MKADPSSRRSALLCGALLLGCTPMIRTAEAPSGWQASLSSPDAAARSANFPLPPPALERLMREPEMEIREVERTQGGVMGARRIEAFHPASGRVLDFKWKEAPDGGEGWNNSPRLEIAAYEIQKWFLSPEEYVVPTAVARCIPLAGYAVVDPEPEPNLADPDARCVFGALSIWLDGLEEPEVQLDEARFYRDPRYARSVAQYNLLTYLVRNRDTRIGNQLISSDPESPRVYSVDNGITFDTRLHNFFRRHFDEIRVPALPRDAVDRLRAVGEDDFAALRVLAELRRDDAGVYRETSPSPAFDPERGVRLRDGVLQLGLDEGEIDGLRKRWRALLRAVEAGEIPTF